MDGERGGKTDTATVSFSRNGLNYIAAVSNIFFNGFVHSRRLARSGSVVLGMGIQLLYIRSDAVVPQLRHSVLQYRQQPFLRGSNVLDFSQHPNDIHAHDLFHVFGRNTALKHCCHDIGVLGDVFQTLDVRWHPVKVGSQAEMVKPDPVADMQNVIDYIFDCGLLGIFVGEPGDEADHDDTTVLLEPIQDMVWDISHVRYQSVATRID